MLTLDRGAQHSKEIGMDLRVMRAKGNILITIHFICLKTYISYVARIYGLNEPCMQTLIFNYAIRTQSLIYWYISLVFFAQIEMFFRFTF